MPGTLVLASTSPYRAALLARLGIAFETVAPQVDESALDGEPPRQRAMRLARAKAEDVAAHRPDDLVLGCDQVACCDGRIHDKPGDAERCHAQLRASSGKACEFYTAVALLRLSPRAIDEHVDYTVVRFRPLSDAEIVRYVELDRPFDCAGGFRSEGRGSWLFESIDSSDPAAIVGLPLLWVAGRLRAAGLDPLVPAPP
jgi:septum formation protein